MCDRILEASGEFKALPQLVDRPLKNNAMHWFAFCQVAHRAAARDSRRGGPGVREQTQAGGADRAANPYGEGNEHRWGRQRRGEVRGGFVRTLASVRVKVLSSDIAGHDKCMRYRCCALYTAMMVCGELLRT